MAIYIISFLSQKGGCGKSTLARLFAQQLAADELAVLLADMDIKQTTSTKWTKKRQKNGLNTIAAQPFSNVKDALRTGEEYSALIFDGAPHASSQTLEIARASDLIVLPTGVANDDLEPAVLLAHELSDNGIEPHRLRFALFRTDKDSSKESLDAREYLSTAGYQVLDGELPDKPSYRRALDAGRAPSETFNPVTGVPYASLNSAAVRLADSIATALTKSTMKASKTKEIAV